MPATLCIHIRSASQATSEEIRFFDAEDWNTESEMQVMAKIQEIFSLTRSNGVAVHFDITIQTHEVSQATFLLKKKAVNAIAINNYKLSIREIEVLGLIMQGLTNNEIAEKLFISYETVKSHRKNILEKTGAKNTASLITYYHQTFFEK
jgi:DNA-binding CsgD family transcriptional regulator